jgi:hypothetical protein
LAIAPAYVLAGILGIFHTALFAFLRGRAGGQIVLILVAAILGSWAGDALGGRLGIDPIRIGDFHVIAASIVAWAGIAFVSVTSVLGAPRPQEDEE